MEELAKDVAQYTEITFEEFVRGLKGRVVTKICRIFWVHRGNFEPSMGQLEIYTEDRMFLLGCWGGNGEDLVIRDAPHICPFDGELSEENAIYVAENGKHERIDCSDQELYSDLINKVILDITPMRSEWNWPDMIGGVKISSETRTMWLLVAGDEEYLHWTPVESHYEI
jgi:hypothetical protein